MRMPTESRPWPAPTRSWAMRMRWLELVFLHWPVPVSALRPHLPPGLELDLFQGQAWVGVVPFRMEDVAPRGVPALPWLSAFTELNLRTYVVAEGKPGVWFFSLDAANPVAVRVARAAAHLPYFDAKMRCGKREGWTHYASQRTHPGAAAAEFRARYRALGAVSPAQRGTLEHWLVERYCLYAADKRQRIFRGEIAHAPWPLQPGVVEIEANTLTDALGFSLSGAPTLVHCAQPVDVVAWNLEKLGK